MASVDKAGADIPAGTHLEEWVLPSVSVSADKQYCWLIKSTSPGAYNSFSMYYQYKYPYADGQMVATNDAGVTWFNWSNYDFAFQVLGDYVSPPSGKPILPRKMAYSGYHCFIEQYQRRRIAGLIPFKLPDGTLYPV